MEELARNMGTAVENMTKMMTLMQQQQQLQKEEADTNRKNQEDMMTKMLDKMVERKRIKSTRT